MSFNQAVSGLNAASTNLDVIGNNIANSATAGFKSGTASFADMFAGSQVGMGVKVAAITQDFSDGTTTNTNRGLDVALSGNGFFRLTDSSGGVFYSRNGQLSLDDKRNLVNTQGLSVTGYPATGTPPTIAQGAQPVPLTIPNTMMIAKPSSSGLMVANLNSSDKLPKNATFSSSDPDSYNYVNTITTYDSLGNKHDNNVYFVKSSDPTTPNSWDVYSQDSSVSGSTAGKLGTLNFNQNGTLRDVTLPPVPPATTTTTSTTPTFSLPMNTANNGAATPQNVALSLPRQYPAEHRQQQYRRVESGWLCSRPDDRLPNQ
ncbi:flagellar hook-basal body protein [Ewingella americana]